VLTPIPPSEDPYQAAAVFARAGSSVVFETPADSGDPLACVELAGAQVLLGERGWTGLRLPVAASGLGAGRRSSATISAPWPAGSWR
jgi:hypothetical protein